MGKDGADTWNSLGSIAERIVRRVGRPLERPTRQAQSGSASEPVKLDASDAARAEQE
jgi:hypothetical protein